MIDINTALQNILKAIYGKDVRESIHDAIYQINQNANEAVELAQIKFGTDVKTPTSPVGSYVEGTVYFNIETGVIWKLRGGSWSMLGTMKTIDSIDKTSTSGLVDTYTILYNDKSTSEFKVTNGEKGVSVSDITKTSTSGNVDHYDINLSDGTTTPNGFDVTNGISVSDITLASTVGNTKNYDVNLSDGTKTPNGFSVTDGTSNYVHIRYSANFDGQGMVTVPTEQTVYIGIVVTTQSNAPTDPAVYSWVRFVGKSGTGTGDMLKADYATLYDNVVDKAAALFDGTKEISATQLMAKSDYATKGVAGTVDKATQLVDVTNSKVADTVVLAKLSESGGKLQYNGKAVDVDIDNNTIVKNASNQLTLGTSVTTKLPREAPSSTLAGKAPVINASGVVEWGEVASGTPKFTQAEWNALSLAEREKYDGKEVIITDDYESNICPTVQACVDSGNENDVAGASVIKELSEFLSIKDMTSQIVASSQYPNNFNWDSGAGINSLFVRSGIAMLTGYISVSTPFNIPNNEYGLVAKLPVKPPKMIYTNVVGVGSSTAQRKNDFALIDTQGNLKMRCHSDMVAGAYSFTVSFPIV